MTIRFATDAETAHWDTHILANPDGGNVFQGYQFAQQKKFGNWTPRFIFADTLAITIIEKSIPGFGKLWYTPKGPGVIRIHDLAAIAPALTEFAKKHGVFSIKIEPELPKTPENLADLLKLHLVRVAPIQPNFSTVIIDLSPDIDTIMAHLNQKGRHAIRRAQRDGVTVRQVSASNENCKKMFDLLSETAAGSFNIRSYEYYKTFWQHFAKANQGQLFFAYTGKRLVAGAFALLFGNKSTYKDGASVRERTVYGASHLLQWHVIEWAKQHGALTHDLCGAPPADQIKNPDHPHYGIGRFKTSFNKEITEYVGAYDIAVQPVVYKIWHSYGERIARKLSLAIHHENLY